jgi:hypothetical protein
MELEEGIVFRLANVRDTFPPDSPKLHVAHFALSDRDKSRDPPLLSVFEGCKTTIEQAKGIRVEKSPSVAFGLRIEDIRDIVVEDLPRLKVLRDPLDPPDCDLPGADGHCGIHGLSRPPNHPKVLYRELRVLLADKSFRYRDGMA